MDGTTLQLGQVHLERNEREVDGRGLPTSLLTMELQDTDQQLLPGSDFNMVYIKQQDIALLPFKSVADQPDEAPLLDI